MSTSFRGGCACGALRYEIAGEPVVLPSGAVGRSRDLAARWSFDGYGVRGSRTHRATREITLDVGREGGLELSFGRAGSGGRQDSIFRVVHVDRVPHDLQGLDQALVRRSSRRAEEVWRGDRGENTQNHDDDDEFNERKAVLAWRHVN